MLWVCWNQRLNFLQRPGHSIPCFFECILATRAVLRAPWREQPRLPVTLDPPVLWGWHLEHIPWLQIEHKQGRHFPVYCMHPHYKDKISVLCEKRRCLFLTPSLLSYPQSQPYICIQATCFLREVVLGKGRISVFALRDGTPKACLW
jgi:hypothetical protein